MTKPLAGLVPIFTLPLLALLAAGCATPVVVGFEGVALPDAGYVDAATSHPTIVVDGVTFATAFDSQYGTSSGAVISSLRDTTTAGYLNAYSAYPGSGAGGSAKFAVWYPIGGTTPMLTFSVDVSLKSIAVANTTYAALSMKSGDAFAKKFTTAGQDYLDVVFTGLNAAGTKTGTEVKFYLADFRTATSPGIQTGWTTVDLTPLGVVRHVAVSFESSDVGSYGINTPTYVALDDLSFFQ